MNGSGGEGLATELERMTVLKTQSTQPASQNSNSRAPLHTLWALELLQNLTGLSYDSDSEVGQILKRSIFYFQASEKSLE